VPKTVVPVSDDWEDDEELEEEDNQRLWADACVPFLPFLFFH
jgi:hypothetical protein